MISNGYVSVELDGGSGWVSAVTTNGSRVAVAQRIATYINGTGGAYILY